LRRRPRPKLGCGAEEEEEKKKKKKKIVAYFKLACSVGVLL
jgi:hypothetical protein